MNVDTATRRNQMRIIRTASVVAVALCAATAFALQVGPKLIINDKPVSGEIIEQKGRLYVAIDDLAQAVGAKTVVTAEPGEPNIIALTFAGATAKDASGGIEGIVTYYFNCNL